MEFFRLVAPVDSTIEGSTLGTDLTNPAFNWFEKTFWAIETKIVAPKLLAHTTAVVPIGTSFSWRIVWRSAKVETSDQEHFIRFIQFSTQLHDSVIFCLSRNSAAVNIRKGGPKAVASNRRGTIQRATCCSCHSVQKPANSFNKDRETSARSIE